MILTLWIGSVEVCVKSLQRSEVLFDSFGGKVKKTESFWSNSFTTIQSKQMDNRRSNTIALFDIDGTLTLPRQVGFSLSF
jgi:hypothetical protein